MLKYIKEQFLENPDKLVEFLSIYGYCNFYHSSHRLQFGRDDFSGKKAICINLTKNDNLYVKDYAKNMSKDIFAFIVEQKNVEFGEVIFNAKSILDISNDYCVSTNTKKGLFGGFFNRFKKNTEYELKTYDESILDKYELTWNYRFLKDHISIKTQKKFGIRYDIYSQGIIIPIRNELGSLVGIKVRKNCNADETDMKYFYEIPCAISRLLYGYSQNYQYLVDADEVLIFEAEKSTMQCDSYGINNCVSLSCCSLTTSQVKLLLALNAKRFVFMLDKGLDKEALDRNIELLQEYGKKLSFEIAYWDSENNTSMEDKDSPSDKGKKILLEILENEIKIVEGKNEIEEN